MKSPAGTRTHLGRRSLVCACALGLALGGAAIAPSALASWSTNPATVTSQTAPVSDASGSTAADAAPSAASTGADAWAANPATVTSQTAPVSDASGSAGADAKASAAAAVTEQDILGEWELATMKVPEVDEEIDVSLFAALMGQDASMTLDFKEDGTVQMEMEGFSTFISSLGSADGTVDIDDIGDFDDIVDIDDIADVDEIGDIDDLDDVDDADAIDGELFGGVPTQATLTWKISGANVVLTNEDGEPQSMTYMTDGSLRLTMEEDGDQIALTFVRPGTEVSTGAAAVQYVEDPQGFEGSWDLTGMGVEGMSPSDAADLFSLLKLVGFSGTLTFNADGTYVLELKSSDSPEDSEYTKGTWEQTGDLKATLSYPNTGGTLDIAIEDGEISFFDEASGDTLVFKMVDTDSQTAASPATSSAQGVSASAEFMAK